LLARDARTEMNHMEEETGTANGYPGAELTGEASQRLAEAREEINDLDRRARRFIQERPLMAVLAAVAGGYLVARLAHRL
jgi:hypothetical protein